MFFQQRVKLKPLAEFLRRMSLSLEAGIDIRKALASEAQRTPPGMRQRIETIAAAAARGMSLAEGLAATGTHFPMLTRELVGVGEETGRLPEVLKRLAAHYDQQIALRRQFFSAIAWPMMQLGISLTVVGLVIWALGLIEAYQGRRIDILGFGLVGTSGLIVYCAVLMAAGFAIYYAYLAISSGRLWLAPVQRLVMRLPKIGAALRTLAVARFAWTLHLTLDAAMDVKRSLSLALSATHNGEFIAQRDRILRAIQAGREINEALAATGVFPIAFIHAVQVGEESGRLVETLELIARQNEDEARRALAFLAQVAAYAVWLVVAIIIVVLIFRIFSFYVGAISGVAA